MHPGVLGIKGDTMLQILENVFTFVSGILSLMEKLSPTYSKTPPLPLTASAGLWES